MSTGVPVSCELVTPTSTEAWAAYHDIRRSVLFEGRGRVGVYDPNHPDDRSPNNFPKVLVWGSKYSGAVRIDFVDDIAYLRRVAIVETDQRKGFGRVLIRLAARVSSPFPARSEEPDARRDSVLDL
jgi:hypothetical protein